MNSILASGIDVLLAKQSCGRCIRFDCDKQSDPRDQLCRECWLSLSPETRRDFRRARNAFVASKGSPEARHRLRKALAKLVGEINAPAPKAVVAGD